MMIDSLSSDLKQTVRAKSRRWVLTGCAGFIGSNLLESLLLLDQEVVGIDDLSTGKRENLDDVKRIAGEKWARFTFHEGSVCDPALVSEAVKGADIVCHQAALGSVPRSVAEPLATNTANVEGFLQVATSAQRAGVRRIVYASSSSVYGDGARADGPNREEDIGRVLSPYAASKRADEIFADAYASSYGVELVGLRYFNVFGGRQDPNGPYAAVIPKWVDTLLTGGQCAINGDGLTTRDFCYVANVVQANLRAGIVPELSGAHAVNIAVGARTSLNELYDLIVRSLVDLGAPAEIAARKPEYFPFRAGDIRHSCADISRAKALIGYEPTHSIADGMKEALPYYLSLAGRS